MKYLTCSEVAALIGTTPRRVQQMCKNGELIGAMKQGRSWMIPSEAFPNHSENASAFPKIKPLPIGVSDFKVATSDYYYVDKTLLIRDFLDRKPSVSLFTRPRRFGKTLNMDMLRVFFEKTDEDTSKYFRDKLIWQCGEEYTSYQGQYPVIFLSFKDVKYSSWEKTFEKICKLLSLEFQRHIELEISPRLNSYEKEQFSQIAKGNANPVDVESALGTLSRLLGKHYGCKTIIIIDEYDTPIQQGYASGFYGDVISFMRNFFSGGLKDNEHLAFGFLTGILRVAKESIFSGLNNLKIDSLLDDAYSKYFGFTKDEITDILRYYETSLVLPSDGTDCGHGFAHSFFPGMDIVVGGRGDICMAKKTGDGRDVDAVLNSPGSEDAEIRRERGVVEECIESRARGNHSCRSAAI